MDYAARKWPDFEHTGPGTLAGRFLRRFWQPVYLSADLPIGQARPLKIMGQQFTIYRGESGTAHVVADRCLHRGTLLSTGQVEGDQIRCFYHGWKYDATGQCVERPAERSCPANLYIRSYPTHEWLNMVFAYLGEGEAPPFPVLSDVADDGYLTVQAPLRTFNYFSQLENALDEVHFRFVHRISRIAEQGLTDAIPTLTCEETDYGLARASTRRGVDRKTHFLMPNINASIFFDALHIVWRVPVDDYSHISFTVDYCGGTSEEMDAYRARHEAEAAQIAAATPASVLVDEVLAGRMSLDELVDHPDLLSIQDGTALKGQGVIANRENELLGASDTHIVHMRRLWTNELTAIRDGAAPRVWQWPDSLEVTSGLPIKDAA